MKKWLIAIGIVILIICASVYYVYNKPHRDIAGSEADFAISAATLLQEFETSEEAANKKYLDKIIAVKGKVKSAETTPEGNMNIALETGSEMSTIICAMLPGENEKAAKIQQGSEITVKGLCTGMLMDVVLTNCSIQ